MILPERALIIKEPWIDMILNGEKTWEMRGVNTKIRGEIALIKSKTGKIFGTIKLVDSIEIFAGDFFDNREKHRIPAYCCVSEIYNPLYAWVMECPKKFNNPIPYKHPKGAVVWVILRDEVV